MAASKEITLTGSEHRIDEIAAEAESFGRYMGLSEKNVLRLRLLSEEVQNPHPLLRLVVRLQWGGLCHKWEECRWGSQ